jgi:hypothetical protein
MDRFFLIIILLDNIIKLDSNLNLTNIHNGYAVNYMKKY